MHEEEQRMHDEEERLAKERRAGKESVEETTATPAPEAEP